MSRENVEIVRQIYDAYLAGDFAAGLAHLDPRVEFDVSIRPEGKVYYGHDGVADALRTWTGTWEAFRMEVEELIDAGNDNVIGIERHTGRGRGSGIPLAEQYGSVFTLHGGKVTRIVWFPSRDQAVEAAGLSG
jgi:ketosteroid isomerase-like protein